MAQEVILTKVIQGVFYNREDLACLTFCPGK